MIKRSASWAVKILLTGLAIFYLQQKVDLAAAWEAARVFSPIYFLVALLLQAVQVAICAMRWQLVLQAIDARLSFWRAVALFSIGNFFGQILPGAVGGDVVRIWQTQRAGLSLSTSINSIMLERAATVLGLALLVTVSEPLLAQRLTDASVLWLFPLLTVGSIAGIGFLMLLDRIPPRFERWRVLRAFSYLAADCRRLFLRPAHALPTMTMVIFGHINLAFVVWSLALGLGAPVSIVDCLVLVPPVILVATLPISIAGWGAREVAMVTLFGLVGVPASQAAALSVLFGLATVLIALPGGVIWLLSGDRTALRTTVMEGDGEVLLPADLETPRRQDAKSP